MTVGEFKNTLSNNTPPDNSHPLLQALWYDAKDQWNDAHDLAQTIETKDGAWVHAYLHRKGGDGSNASYWYRLAGKKMSTRSLNEEWEEIVKSLLKES